MEDIVQDEDVLGEGFVVQDEDVLGEGFEDEDVRGEGFNIPSEKRGLHKNGRNWSPQKREFGIPNLYNGRNLSPGRSQQHERQLSTCMCATNMDEICCAKKSNNMQMHVHNKHATISAIQTFSTRIRDSTYHHDLRSFNPLFKTTSGSDFQNTTTTSPQFTYVFATIHVRVCENYFSPTHVRVHVRLRAYERKSNKPRKRTQKNVHLLLTRRSQSPVSLIDRGRSTSTDRVLTIVVTTPGPTRHDTRPTQRFPTMPP